MAVHRATRARRCTVWVRRLVGGWGVRRVEPAAGRATVTTHWDDTYRDGGRPWGEGPSELAAVAVERLRSTVGPGLSILDVGCGYGRDSRHLSRELGAAVLGIDLSAEGIAAAREWAPESAGTGARGTAPTAAGSAAGAPERQSAVEYRCAGFEEIAAEVERGSLDAFDVVFVSNLYQLLGPRERAGLRRALGALLKPAGLLFLSTLSTGDPQHYGAGEPVPGERDSFTRPVYLHFCREEELREDFSFLSVGELREREYDEPHADGSAHHHVSWILIARRP